MCSISFPAARNFDIIASAMSGRSLWYPRGFESAHSEGVDDLRKIVLHCNTIIRLRATFILFFFSRMLDSGSGNRETATGRSREDISSSFPETTIAFGHSVICYCRIRLSCFGKGLGGVFCSSLIVCCKGFLGRSAARTISMGATQHSLLDSAPRNKISFGLDFLSLDSVDSCTLFLKRHNTRLLRGIPGNPP